MKAIERFAQMNVKPVKVACSFIKKKRYHLRVKQYKLAHLVYVVGTAKSDKAEAKTSSEGAWSLPFLYLRSHERPCKAP